MNHFTMQQGRDGDVGVHGSCVRSSGISGVGAGVVGVDARVVSPYIIHVDNQRLAPCVAISAISPRNMGHIGW